jgi:hypothetical protein
MITYTIRTTDCDVKISRHFVFRILLFGCFTVVGRLAAVWQHCRRNDGRSGGGVLQLANFLWKC